MSPDAELVVFGLDQRRCALLLGTVDRAVRMVALGPLPRAPRVVLGVINVGGDLVPVLDARQRFGLPARPPRASDFLLIARTSRRRVALPVDQVEGLQRFPAELIDSAASLAPGLEHLRGVVKLAGHELVYIHDLEAFLSLEEEAALERATQEAAGA